MQHGGNVWEGGNPEYWLDFSANLRPEGCPGWVRDTVVDAIRDVRYYPDREMKAAAAGLALYAGVSEDHIMPTAGGSAAIDLAISLTEGSLLIPGNTFSEYRLRAECRGIKTAVWNGNCHAGDAVIICNPNNPTGRLFSRSNMLELHRKVHAAGARLIVDEAFIDFCPAESVRDMSCESLIVVGSLTKILGIPGIRLGYLCADSSTVSRLKQAALPWALSAFASAIAQKLPLHMDEIRAEANINAERRKKLAEGISSLGATVFPSSANFILAEFERDMTDAAALLKKKGILVRTCASFGLKPNKLRIAVKTDEENNTLLEALRQIMEK